MFDKNKIISIITNKEIRFEGYFLKVNKEDKTIILKDVINYGTEDRKSGTFVRPDMDKLDLMVFKSNDIKDLKVLKDAPQTNTQKEKVYSNTHNKKPENKPKNKGTEIFLNVDNSKTNNIENLKKMNKDNNADNKNYKFDDFFDTISSSFGNQKKEGASNLEIKKKNKETFGYLANTNNRNNNYHNNDRNYNYNNRNYNNNYNSNYNSYNSSRYNNYRNYNDTNNYNNYHNNNNKQNNFNKKHKREVIYYVKKEEQ